ncbi:MAG TPA: hypothetical protein VNB49_12270, partial [Candidatus Dormibacteraeota bacterium]|nr:hypothetical protein [Candidatus Dormibacteraeota bacterium]
GHSPHDTATIDPSHFTVKLFVRHNTRAALMPKLPLRFDAETLHPNLDTPDPSGGCPERHERVPRANSAP